MSCSERGEPKLLENDTNKDRIELEEKRDEIESNKVQEERSSFTWKSYHNQRFDFCVSYPSSFLREKGESENQDGNTFANANGSSEMRASAMYNALEESIKEAFQSATKNERYYEDERIVMYKQQKDNWFVVSGKYNESIFYVRTVLIEDTFYSLYFEYHPSERKQFDEIIKRVCNDFPDC